MNEIRVSSLVLAVAGLSAGIAILGCSEQPSASQHDEPAAEANAPTAAASPIEPNSAEPTFTQVRHPGAVNVEEEYDLSGLTIPRDEMHAMLPRDEIPALTDPETELAGAIDWLDPDDRLIEVTIGRETMGFPLRIMESHEIVNVTLAGRPIAAVY